MSPSSAVGQLADDSGWRERLLASLRDCGVQPAPRNAALRWIILMVVLAAIGVLTLVVHQLLRTLESESNPLVRIVPLVAWYLFAVFALARVRNYFLRQAWQSTAATAEDELARPGARRPILYLRSFGLDERVNRRSWRERFLGVHPEENAEQALTKTLRAYGPTIAIGRPGESLPPLGAARFYASDECWQQKVSDVTAEAQFVVWATGKTEGLRWEIDHLVAAVPPEKVIVWAHPHLLRLPAREREMEWEKFRSALGGAFPQPLPAILGEARFIYFTAGWEPHPVAPQRGPVPWLDPIRAALRAILAVKTGADNSGLRRWFARLGPIGLVLIVVAFLAAFLAPALPDSTRTSLKDNEVISQYGYVNEFNLFGMFANVALVLLTVTLGWGQAAWWRRFRLAAALALALFALGMAAWGVYDERGNAYRDDHTTVDKSNDEQGIVQNKYTDIREVQAGAYVKLAVALGIVTVALGFVRSGWRSTNVANLVPLTAAEIAYPGPGNDTFAELIGAAGLAVNWTRAAGFFIALAAMGLTTSLNGSGDFSPLSALLLPALIAAAAIAAFRCLGSGIAPVVAALLVAVAWTAVVAVLGRSNPSVPEGAEVIIMFVRTLALLAGLSWATRRMGPRPLALWFGAMWGAVPMCILELMAGEWAGKGEGLGMVTLLIGPVVFAAVEELALRWSRPERKAR